MSTKPLLTIASGNPRKVAEIEAMLGPLPLNVQRQPSDLEVKETGSTYLENALIKAKEAAKITKRAYQLLDAVLIVNSFDTKIKVPPKPINIPNIFPNFKEELKKVIPIKRVNSGVIPFNTAATDESITVSAKAKR